ncbi:MAG: response regulator [Anaerolineae bacterium]|nr:response regulator [Anaerolineae bacterium]
MDNWRLLVVEDDVDGQEVVSRILRHHKIPFDVATSGEDALHLLTRNTYTGAILDLSLPGMDGWTLLDTLQKSPTTHHIKCVAVTAYHSADVAVKAIEAGFVAYFPKPLEATSFVRELERAVA